MLNTRARGRTVTACALAATLGLAACGGDDFANDPRPAQALAITGVITEREVTISPGSFGAGPVVLTISNQTQGSHSVTLVGKAEDGAKVDETAGPINPFDAATIQYDLAEGRYEVRANSDPSRLRGGIDPGEPPPGIEPGKVVVGPPRPSASNEVEQP